MHWIISWKLASCTINILHQCRFAMPKIIYVILAVKIDLSYAVQFSVYLTKGKTTLPSLPSIKYYLQPGFSFQIIIHTLKFYFNAQDSNSPQPSIKENSYKTVRKAFETSTNESHNHHQGLYSCRSVFSSLPHYLSIFLAGHLN